MTITISEDTFLSVQGEGNRTGILTMFVRFAACNLRCPGFFQPDPANPDTYEKPLLKDPKEYKSLDELPVIPFGCDTLYAIDPKFKHLWKKYDTAKEFADEQINPLLYNGHQWNSDKTGNYIDLCFTGGEPLLQQKSVIQIAEHIDNGSLNHPQVIQIETNGTKKITPDFIDYFDSSFVRLNWNISPKLFNVSGEKDCVNYENIRKYFRLSPYGCLKFVVNEKQECWDELLGHVKQLRGVPVPIFVMPVGSTQEQQTDSKVLTEIANRAIDNGFHVSGRLHSVLFGNAVGT